MVHCLLYNNKTPSYYSLIEKYLSYIMTFSFIIRAVFTDKHSSLTCLWRLVFPTLTILRTMSRVRLLDSGQDCSLMCLRNSQGQQISGKTLESLVKPSTRILLVTLSLMIDTAHLMQSVRGSNIHLYYPFISFIILTLYPLQCKVLRTMRLMSLCLDTS